ncbi:MAG: diguanylate cyclase [Candidatus Riflebacteria bacterium]|nr:diguanylate cyclase [Candidatus Riflebacteria bacterium]
MKSADSYRFVEWARSLVPWRPYIESTLLLGLVALANWWLFPGNPAFKGLPFTLLMIPIILIASRYGTLPSTFVGTLCSGYYFFQISLENFSRGKLFVTFDDKVTICFFMATAIFLGHMFEVWQTRTGKLQKEYLFVKKQFENLKLHNRSLEGANQKLEKRIVSRYTTLNSLYEMAQYLESLSEPQLFRGILELVKRFLQADRICLYIVEETGDIKLGETLGYSDAEKEKMARRIPGNSLIHAGFDTDRVLTFRDGFEDQPGKKDGTGTLIVAPIRFLNSTKTIGVIAVDNLPFLAINAVNIRVLGMIADWAARALEKTKTFSALSSRMPLFDKVGGVYSQSYFEIRLSQEMSRAIRHRLPLTLLMIGLDGLEKTTPEKREETLAEVGNVLSRSLRDLDIPCRYHLPDIFALILPLTDSAGAKIFVGRLRTKLDIYASTLSSELPLRLKLAAHVFHGGHEKETVEATLPVLTRRFLEEVEEKFRQT